MLLAGSATAARQAPIACSVVIVIASARAATSAAMAACLRTRLARRGADQDHAIHGDAFDVVQRRQETDVLDRQKGPLAANPQPSVDRDRFIFSTRGQQA